jgi:hypothetical protein
MKEGSETKICGKCGSIVLLNARTFGSGGPCLLERFGMIQG